MIHSISEHIQLFTRQYMPSGLVWNDKNNPTSNIRRLVEPFCQEYQRMETVLHEFLDEMMPDTSNVFLHLWEKALGMPDDCFRIATTLQERRDNVKIKLSLLGLQTKSDFEGFASRLGLDIKVRGGIDHVSIADGGYETELPVIDIPGIFADVKDARFTIVVTSLTSTSAFDYDFNFPFEDANEALMRCLFEKAKPSNCKIIFTSE